MGVWNRVNYKLENKRTQNVNRFIVEYSSVMLSSRPPKLLLLFQQQKTYLQKMRNLKSLKNFYLLRCNLLKLSKTLKMSSENT